MLETIYPCFLVDSYKISLIGVQIFRWFFAIGKSQLDVDGSRRWPRLLHNLDHELAKVGEDGISHSEGESSKCRE